MPGLVFPAPPADRLEHSPLELVVCQVRHERLSGSSDAGKAFAVRDGLGGRYPLDEEATAVNLNVSAGPGGMVPTGSERQRGWNFKSTDGAWTVVLMPDFFSLETRAYTDWQDFSERLRAVVGQVEEVLKPSIERRLGLRLIDRITDPKVDSPQGWEGWINDRLLGPVLHPSFGPALKGLQQAVQLDGGDNVEVLLRHGFAPEGAGEKQAWPYLLDHDCSRSGGRTFSAGAVMKSAEQLHDLALAIFRASITTKLYDHLRGGS